jgi:uncharacterized membrane protein
MILAAYRDTGYNVVLFLHILTVIIAFAPAVVNPLIDTRIGDDRATTSRFSAIAASNNRMVHLPALVLAGLFGVLLVVMSDEAIGFDELWISLSFLVWIAIAGLVSGMIMPNERRVGQGDLDAHKKVVLGGQLASLLLLVMLYLMIFKPGADVL